MNELINKLKERTNLSLDNVRIVEATVYVRHNQIEIVLLCPENEEKALLDEANALSKAATEILKTSFKVRIKIKKSYFEEAYFSYTLLGFLKKFPLIHHNVKSESFDFEYEGDLIKALIKVPSTVADYITGGNIMSEIKAFVHNNFCEKIEVEIVGVPLENEEIVVEDEANKYVYDFEGGRHIKVSNVEAFIGDPIYEPPGYIADIRLGDGQVFTGVVKDFVEYKRNMKEGETEQKYFFKFRLEDFTGSVECIYFPTKKSLDKIRLLGSGKAIVAFGTVENNTFRGVKSLVYKIRYISLCTLPENFVINRARMVVPSEYKTVKPEPYVEYEQDNVFKVKEPVPEFLIGKEFVVYDLETTGLDRSKDRIIEIGAVRIKDGVMTETFSSLINPECLIPQKTTALTGITDAAVKGAPTIAEVMPDFYKFCDGAIMVGQNSIQFDWPFLREKAEPMKIYFENEQLDIMLLAKQFYPELGKYNLDFLSKQFGVVNEEAHRAISDTVTTAKIFIKLAANMT